MSASDDELANINIDHDWQWCRRPATDNVNDIVVSASSTDRMDAHHWAPLDLPHVITPLKQDDTRRAIAYNCWYRKQFDWSLFVQQSEQQINLTFEPLDIGNTLGTSNVVATIWLNETQVFSGSLVPYKSIELARQLLHRDEETKKSNTLVVCCLNGSLSLHARLVVEGQLICASGQVKMDTTAIGDSNNSTKKKSKILDYTVSLNDSDGRIGVHFNSRKKSDESLQSSLSRLSEHDLHEKQTTETPEIPGDVPIPRLAIVILIVGTRGDVQPFIAAKHDGILILGLFSSLGLALRAAGHRVRLATHETFRSFVRGNGLEFFPLAGDPADLMAFMVKNAGIIPSMSSIVAGDITKKRRTLAEILASTWLACTADDDETSVPFIAEAIIANPPSFGHIHCAEKLQIPLHVTFTMPYSPTTAFPHPLCKIDNSKGPSGKLNLYSYGVVEMLTWSGMSDLINNFRKDILGLSTLHTRQATNALIDEQVPHTYCWSPSLVPKPPDWGPHIDVSGFFFLDLGTTYTNPPDDLLNFLGLNDHDQSGDRPPPPIYIGFGSITGHDSSRLLRVVLEALDRTGYRALLSGLATDSDHLPANIFKIGNVPHDWLFQHVSAVCHHGGAGTTAAGLRAGKPTIIVPFFGDQFFWGCIMEKSGAGPGPLPGKSVSVDQLVEAFKFVHQPTTQAAADRIRQSMSNENGCAAAVRAFHANLPISRMHSDLEPTFAACYHLKEFKLQVSRPVAQVLVAAGVIDVSQLHHHATRQWQFMYDDRFRVPTIGVFEHTQKALSSMFLDSAAGLKRAANSSNNLATGALEGAQSVAKGFGKGIGHLTLGGLSLYGEVTDVLDHVPSLYDPYSETDTHKRPRVTSFKSGAKAAGLSLWHGWKDGLTGIVTKPRAGYERHGAMGGAAGALIGTVNVIMKPAVGTLSSLTWLSRGTYASAMKEVKARQAKGKHTAAQTIGLASPSCTTNDEQQHQNDDKISQAAHRAAAVSGFLPEVCQQILLDFEKIKMEHEKATIPSSSSKRQQPRLQFTRQRSHSSCALEWT